MDPEFASAVKYEEVLKYTNYINPENYISHFQFGKIYHGVIDRCNYFQHATVKIWDTSNSVFRDNQLRLMREVILLSDEKVQCQPAAVELFGYLCDGEHLCVIYCLKALTTVRNQLNQDDFNWVRRIRVALCFARMVRFFHNEKPPYGPLVIHNIDAAHILLDEDYVPKLFDFDQMTGGGIFPDGPLDETETPREKQGTAEHDDVFAFGLLLLSLISKRFISKEEAVESLIPLGSNLHELNSVGPAFCNKSASLSLVHVTFESEPYFYATDGEEVSRLAMQCMSSSPNEHPSMKQVVRRLQKLQVVQNHSDLLEVKPNHPSKYRFRSLGGISII